MVNFQMWIVSTFAKATPIARLMHSKWGWPFAESAHFIGLSLLVATIVLFDLRLLGVGRRIPIAALHKLIPWGLTGFGINVISGSLFLITEPDQYVYNTSFHFKLFFMMTAGINASLFYVTSYRRVTADGAPADAPRVAKIIAAVSLCCWIGVIIGGRLLTFYRPYPCGPEGPTFLAHCIPGYDHQ